jgi:hypothetical protein
LARRSRISALFAPIVEKDQGDFFAYPLEKKDFAPVAVFRNWILREAAATGPKELKPRSAKLMNRGSAD